MASKPNRFGMRVFTSSTIRAAAVSGILGRDEVEVAVALGPGEVGDGAPVDAVGCGDDPALRRLAEHLGQPHHRHRAGGNDVGQHLARPHRRQLVDIAHDQEGGFVGDRRQQRPHQHHVHHRRLVDHQQAAVERVVRVAPEPAIPGVDLQQAVDRLRLQPGVGVRRRRRVVHQPVAHQGRGRDLARHMLASLEGNRRQIAQGVEVGQQRRRLPPCLQRVEPLKAARQQPLVQDRQVMHLRDRHHEPAPCRLHQGLDLALVVALAGPAEAVAEQVVRLQVGEGLRAPTRAVAQDPCHRKRRVVIEDRSRQTAEEGEGADMAVQEGLRRLPRIGP